MVMEVKGTDDAERRAKRLTLIMREMDLTNESAVLVDDLALKAAENAVNSIVMVVNTAPNEVIRTAVMIHALRMIAASAEQSAEINEVIRAMAMDISRASGIPLGEVMGLLAVKAQSGEPVAGDSCDCPACAVRRTVLGPDRGYDAVKAAMGDPGVKLSDLVEGLLGRNKGKPH